MDNYSFIMTCVAQCFGDTLKEKYEGIYCKLIEASYLLLTKVKSKNIDPGKLRLFGGKDIAAIFASSRTYCFCDLEAFMKAGALDGKPYLGSFNDNLWEVYQDTSVNSNEAVIRYDCGDKAKIIFEELNLDNC